MARIYLSPPDVGPRERELLVEAFDSGWIAPLGPHVDAFEREMAACVGVPHATALSSGTAGLHLALHMLGVEPGDEVLTSTLTFVATANAIASCGATPVLVDAEAQSWNLDPDLLAEALADRARRGRLPRAVVAVDLYGQCADYGRIEPLCAEHGVPLVEDAAEALGARCGDRCAGSFGEMAVLSFNGNKILTTSGGGMLLSADGRWTDRARFLATQARDPAPHYQHSVVGFNYRLSNLLAAVGRAQLEGLPGKLAARAANRRFYEALLGGRPGIALLPVAPWGTPNHWLTCVLVDPTLTGTDREAIRLHLERHDIESRPVWKPMHLQPLYAGAPRVGGAVSEGLFRDGLCLPSGSNLTDADRARIGAALLEALSPPSR